MTFLVFSIGSYSQDKDTLIVSNTRQNRQTLFNVGKKYYEEKDFVKAETAFKKALAAAYSAKDTLMEASILRSYSALLVDKEEPSAWAAINMLGRVSSDLGQDLSKADMEVLAYAFSLLNNSEEAAAWMKKARSIEEKKDVVPSEKPDYSAIRLWALIFLFTAILATMFWYFRVKKLQNEKALDEEKQESEKYMDLAADLQAKLQAANKRLPSEKHLSIAKFDVLERLCEQYYVYEGTDNLQSKILKEVKNVIQELRSNKSLDGLEMMLNKNYDNVVVKLKEQMPKLSNEDLRLFVFVASGFSSTTISTILEKEKSVVYNRIWRLKNRISASEAPDKDFFLECLNK